MNNNEESYKGKYTREYLLAGIELHGGCRQLARHLNNASSDKVTESGIREFLKRTADTNEDTRPVAAGTVKAPDARRKQLTGTRFVFTSAQNNTLIHEDFYSSLLNFCAHRGAELIVSRFSYNKHGFQNSTKEDDDLWYDKRLKEYFMDESAQVADDLIFCGELDILPTAVNPLSGFEGYCQGASGIIPHTKVAMQSLPRMKGDDPRFLYTTGAVTLRNYIQKKAGQKAEFHHVFGAMYVEIDEFGTWFARQIIADAGGEFYDLTEKFTPYGVEEGHNVLALNYGDIHAEKSDAEVDRVSFMAEDSVAKTLQPDWHFIHDLTDFTARNHHNIKDPYFLAERLFRGEDSVEANIDKSARFLQMMSSLSGMTVVVESNHDQAFQRWLREADIRLDPKNAEYFHKMNGRVFEAIRRGEEEFSIYEEALRGRGLNLDDVIFLREDESFVIANDPDKEEVGDIVGGIECGLHGHRGPNGARGTSQNLKRIGRKVNLGHSHSAGIVDGAYVAGVTGKLDMDYNKGPSSWSHSHIVTYPNGKRAIITIKENKWRA